MSRAHFPVPMWSTDRCEPVFTSDPHFGHRLVARLRGFGEDTCARHTASLGAVTADSDTCSVCCHDRFVMGAFLADANPGRPVYFLGDLSIESKAAFTNALALVDSIPASHKVLVVGNHDGVFGERSSARSAYAAYREVFDEIHQSAAFSYRDAEGKKQKAMLSHFPYAGRGDRGQEPERYTDWRLVDNGRWLVHGHLHSEDVVTSERSVHVGFDAWGRFVSQSDILSIIRGERPFTAAR